MGDLAFDLGVSFFEKCPRFFGLGTKTKNTIFGGHLKLDVGPLKLDLVVALTARVYGERDGERESASGSLPGMGHQLVAGQGGVHPWVHHPAAAFQHGGVERRRARAASKAMESNHAPRVTEPRLVEPKIANFWGR